MVQKPLGPVPPDGGDPRRDLAGRTGSRRLGLRRQHRYGYSAVIGEVSRATISLSGDFADRAFGAALAAVGAALTAVLAKKSAGPEETTVRSE